MKFHFLVLAFLCPLTLFAQEKAISRRLIICFVEEPWQSPYMLFMLPGLIMWIVGAIWCFRKNNIRGSAILQVLGAVEIVMGGIFALIISMKSVFSSMMTHGRYDTVGIAGDFAYFSEIAIIGLIIHSILLAITSILVIRAKRNLKQIEPVS